MLIFGDIGILYSAHKHSLHLLSLRLLQPLQMIVDQCTRFLGLADGQLHSLGHLLLNVAELSSIKVVRIIQRAEKIGS